MRTKKILILFLLLTNLTIITAATEDITFTLDQKEYYFKIREPATLNIKTENTYGKNISGQLSTTITQQITTQNMQQSSTSSNSIPATISKEENQMGITFGTSNQEATWEIKLSFEYYEKENRAVNIENIKFHFVTDESQKENKQNQQQSSSESQESQQQKQMQEQMEKIQQEGQQQTQEKLANSQNPQDSSALKKQMKQQNQQQQAEKEEFKKSLEQNQQLQQEHQKMLDQGYKLKDMQMNPTGNNSGDFKMSYEKENGNQAQIKGDIKNNSLQNLETYTEEEKQEALNQLKQNKDFQKIQEQLQKENFSSQNTNIEKNKNETEIKMKYTNEKNETATITARIENQAVKEVKLEKENPFTVWNWIMIAIILATLIFITNKVYQKYNPKQTPQIIPQKKKEKPYNYKKASKQLLEKSKKLFEQKQYKDAYEKSSQAIRLFLSHTNDLKKETTNDELIKHLKEKNQKTTELKKCFDLCSLVEFAKYSPNKSDFKKITTFAEKLINE
jgi:hypothetical protein